MSVSIKAILKTPGHVPTLNTRNVSETCLLLL